MTGAAPSVSAVLVNFRTPGMTLDCVRSITEHCRATPHEIIVVENGSGDDSADRLRAEGEGFLLVTLPVNIGFGGGCNAGAREAKGKYIYLLNTDTLLHEDSAGVLARFLDSAPSAAAAGSRLIGRDGKAQRAAFNFPTAARVFFGAEGVGEAVERRMPALRGRLSQFIPEERLRAPCRVDWCCGASLMIRADAYRGVGGFDEDFFLYAEETDLCRRLLAFGETWFTPETTVTHLEGATFGEGKISPLRMGYMAAGRKLYYKKHHSAAGALLCNIADCGGAFAKGLALRLAALFGGNPRRLRRAQELFAYARNYFRCTYPLKKGNAC